MKTEKTYNGWTNYETWLVKLWMDNEEGSSSFWNEQAQDAYNNADADDEDGNGGFSKKENAALTLADALKEEHEEIVEQSGVPSSGFIADLMNAAMSEVNWHEIAESLLGDIETDEEDSEKEEA